MAPIQVQQWQQQVGGAHSSTVVAVIHSRKLCTKQETSIIIYANWRFYIGISFVFAHTLSVAVTAFGCFFQKLHVLHY